MNGRWITPFGFQTDQAPPLDDARQYLGNKGYHLASMASLGLPIPPGFTISADLCQQLSHEGACLPSDVLQEILAHLQAIEIKSGLRFGDPEQPLLLSVRSGAAISMPGMLDTISNLGAPHPGSYADPPQHAFAYDTYRRFLQTYASAVLDIESFAFDEVLESYKDEHGFENDADLDLFAWRTVVSLYEALIAEEAHEPIPTDPYELLQQCIMAVFRSWHGRRAKSYRSIQNIDDAIGTAVTIQQMVFGNRDHESATGVFFTRNPVTGQPGLTGEYLPRAQGDDIVSGFRTPQPLTRADALAHGLKETNSFEAIFPQAYTDLQGYAAQLERHFQEMQEIEFTLEQDTLYLLQTRLGKRTPEAAVRIAADLVREGITSAEKAVANLTAEDLAHIRHPRVDRTKAPAALAQGLGASPGVAQGRLVLTKEEAVVQTAQGEAVVLIRPETSPEDISGIHAAAGLLTNRGGMTSHAAVVTRSLGKPCVCSARAVVIDQANACVRVHNAVLEVGEWITIDGSSGALYRGRVPIKMPPLDPAIQELIKWWESVQPSSLEI